MNNVRCPYCDKEHIDFLGIGEMEDEEEIEAQCPHCDKYYTITAHLYMEYVPCADVIEEHRDIVTEKTERK